LEDLKDIIDKCSSGDTRAQEKLYRMFASKMFGVCLRYARDRSEAEDNLQDGFIKVFSNIKKFRFEGSFEGWMRRIMVNVSLGKYRKHNVLMPVDDIEKFDLPYLSEDIIAKLDALQLLELIQQLSPRYRMVFNLFVMEGMGHQEISKIMNISVGTSKSNLARAREILKRKVQDLYRDVKSNKITLHDE
jgi:RNA polymerase sigma factor (sigma-70 family)